MSELKVGDKVKLMPKARGTDSVEEVENALIRLGVTSDDVFSIKDTDYEGDGDVLVCLGGESVWVYPWFLRLEESAVNGDDSIILESKIRRAIDFLEVDWESVDVDRVLKLAKELV